MRLIIRDDAQATSSYVANYIVDRINAYKPTPANPFVLGLPTGSSPLGVYKALVEKYKAGEVRSVPCVFAPTRAVRPIRAHCPTHSSQMQSANTLPDLV